MSITLYEDWQQRREKLANGDVLPPVRGYRETLVKVLDFLLEVYKDAEEVRQPARFPIPAELYLSNRNMLIHSRVRRARGTQNETDAQKRVAGILGRIAAQEPQKSVKAPANGRDVGDLGLIPETFKTTSLEPFRDDVFDSIERFNNEQRELPQEYLDYLVTRIRNKPRAWYLLSKSVNPASAQHAVALWRDTPMSLDLFIQNPVQRERTLDLVREELCNAIPRIRLRSIEFLARFGELHDFGMLLDLMNLKSSEILPEERRALVVALEQMAERFSNERLDPGPSLQLQP